MLLSTSLWTVVILSQLHVSQSHTKSFIVQVEKSSKLIGEDLLDMTIFDFPEVSSWPFCARLCVLRKLCKSIVYDTSTEQCTGYIVKKSEDDSEDYSLVSGSNKIYIEAENIPKILADACADNPCEKYQSCLPANGTHFCLNLGWCTKYSPSGGHVHANLVEHQSVMVGCDADDSGEQIEYIYTSWCFGTNRWTPVNPNCG